MAVLDETQKRFVVRRNAHRIRPKQIQAEFKAEFNLDITGVQVCDLDPETAHGGERMGDELTKYFWAEREKYSKSEDAAPLNNRAVRQAMRLHKMETDSTLARSPKLWLDFMEQASQDAGGHFERGAATAGKSGAAPAEADGTGDAVTGEGDGDDNDAGTNRTRAFRRLLGTARTRRIGETAKARRTGPPAPPAGGTEEDH